MKVLIVGANGFIGSHLLSYLVDHKIDVMGVIRKKTGQKYTAAKLKNIFTIEQTTPVEAQIQEIFRKFKPSKVVNAAVYFTKEETDLEINKYIEANFRLPFYLAQNCMLQGADLLNISSYWQFDSQGKYDPNTMYAASKNAFEVLLDYWVKIKKIKGTSIVLYDTYGENDKRDKLINILMKSIIQNRNVELYDVQRMINLSHVSDIVNGITNVLELQDYERFYELSNDEDILVESLVKIIQDILSINLKVNYSKVIDNQWPSSDKHRVIFPRPLHWKTNISLKTGIQDLYRYNSVS